MGYDKDIDTPVDEALLMGSDEADTGEDAGDTGTDTDTVPPVDTPDESGKEAVTVTGDDKAGEADEGRDNRMIPMTRFNEVYRELKDAKTRLEELQAAGNKADDAADTAAADEPEVVDIKALRRQAKEAFIEGDLDKAEEIEAKIDAENQRRAEEAAFARFQQVQTQKDVQGVVAEIEAQYPKLKSDGGSHIAIATVQVLRDQYREQGMDFITALRKAAADVAGEYGWDKAAPVDQPESKKDPRPANAVRRGIETDKAIPPNDGGVGERAREPGKDAVSMTQKEWEKLSDSEREALLAA